jgi:hypothetical protein
MLYSRYKKASIYTVARVQARMEMVSLKRFRKEDFS